MSIRDSVQSAGSTVVVDPTISDAGLLEKDNRYCSFGDTVHYANPPKIFKSCDGSYLFDEAGTPFLDLQMWY